MKKQVTLWSIFWIALAGLIFSGYLSFTELFLKFCGASQLGLGQCTSIIGVPACVFGFFMYLVILIISIIGIKSKD